MIARLAQPEDNLIAAFPGPPPAAPYAGTSQEWYTPAHIIAAVYEVMDGGIDLDPASCAKANETVQAKKFYTEEQNGLEQPWTLDGQPVTLWLNPPFGTVRSHAFWQGRSLAGFFYQRARDEYARGNVKEAIILLKADPKQSWFWPFWATGPLCFCRDRVYFDRPEGEATKQQFGTAFAYMGPHEQRFIDTFSRFGDVARRVSPRRIMGTMQALWTP